MNKKLISFALALVLALSACASAFAATKTIAPGKSSGALVKDITASPTVAVTLAGRSGDKATIQVDLWDVECKRKDKYQYTNGGTFEISSGARYLTFKPKDMPFKKDRTTRVRLRIWAPSTNKGSIDAIYSFK